MARPETQIDDARATDERRPAVRLDGVRKRFGDVVAVDGIDLDVREGEFFSMLGPSGSGKTTCLRMIAGFEVPTEGRVFLGERDVTDLAPYERDVNTVFQDYALFPHMTVADNVAYGLKVKKVSKDERRERATEALAMVQLSRVRRPQARPALGRSTAAGRSGARAREPPEGACCSTSRSARWTSSSARRCRSS